MVIAIAEKRNKRTILRSESMYSIDISKEEWEEILEIIQKYNRPYTTHLEKE